MEVSDQHHAPAALFPVKNTGTHCIEACAGPRSGIGRSGEDKYMCV